MLELLIKKRKLSTINGRELRTYADKFKVLVLTAPEQWGLVGKEVIASRNWASLVLEEVGKPPLITSDVKEVTEDVIAKTITYRTANSTYTVKVLELL